jgi:uncharacterized phage protein gp47/JayE
MENEVKEIAKKLNTIAWVKSNATIEIKGVHNKRVQISSPTTRAIEISIHQYIMSRTTATKTTMRLIKSNSTIQEKLINKTSLYITFSIREMLLCYYRKC